MTWAGVSAAEPGAESAPLAALSLEELVNVEVASVYGASKRIERVTDAPSSVTLVTADEVQKFGYRTLADVLRGVRGFYVTSDRNYSYLGVRGFNRPGDFNGRTLLTVDGHRINDNVYDSIYVGTEFVLDVDLIDRVEIIRGPGSAIYGSSAFFGVINVVTRQGTQPGIAELSAEVGSFDSAKGRLTYGRQFDNGLNLMMSGSLYGSEGADDLYYREFDVAGGQDGHARGRDGDMFGSGLLTLTYEDWRFQAGYSSREKDIPTGSYGTMFDHPGNRTLDERGYVDLSWQHEFEGDWEMSARGFVDYMRYDGNYVYDHAAQGDPVWEVENRDLAEGVWAGGEARLRRQFADRHAVTVGIEGRSDIRQRQQNYDESPYLSYLDHAATAANLGVFAQADVAVFEPVMLNAGLRYDYYDTFGGTLNPRLGLIYQPGERTSLKALYGTAFRAPNSYETSYADSSTAKGNPDLEPERIATYELVWEQYGREGLRFTTTAFYYQIDDLISQTMDPVDGLIYYGNLDEAEAVGAEAEIENRWSWGLVARASYSVQRVEDAQGHRLSNSPQHLAKLNVHAPVVPERFFIGVELQYASARDTLDGGRVGDVTWLNATLLYRNLLPGLTASASVYNLLDQQYSDPGGAEHLQSAIQQDGVSFRFKLTYAF